MLSENIGGIPSVITSSGGHGSDFGGFGGAWGFIIGLLLGRGGLFGGGLGGYGAGGAVANVDNTTWTAQNFTRLENGQNAIQSAVRGVSDGLCSLGFNLNNSIKDTAYANAMAMQQGFAAQANATCTLGYEMANQFAQSRAQAAECCCQTLRAIDGVNNSITAAVGAIGGMFKDAELREAYAKINAQGTELSEQRVVSTILQNLQPPRAVPAYQVCNPYTGQVAC